jgi:hypothetical protein
MQVPMKDLYEASFRTFLILHDMAEVIPVLSVNNHKGDKFTLKIKRSFDQDKYVMISFRDWELERDSLIRVLLDHNGTQFHGVSIADKPFPPLRMLGLGIVKETASDAEATAVFDAALAECMAWGVVLTRNLELKKKVLRRMFHGKLEEQYVQQRLAEVAGVVPEQLSAAEQPAEVVLGPRLTGAPRRAAVQQQIVAQAPADAGRMMIREQQQMIHAQQVMIHQQQERIRDLEEQLRQLQEKPRRRHRKKVKREEED